jgi:cytohesin
MKPIFIAILLSFFVVVNAQPETPDIVTAAAKRNISKIKSCIKNGDNVNAKSPSQWSALSYAVLNKDEEMAKLLLDNKADVNITINTKESPLLMASKYNNTSMGRLLINYKADINFKDIMDFTVLHWAAKNGNKELIELLLTNGATINHKNINGRTPLDVANASVKDLLINKGAKTGQELFKNSSM